MHSCGNVNTQDFKKGFNNRYISFQHPFHWKYLEADNEFVVAKLHDPKYNSVITVSVSPCVTNDIEDMKEIVESDFKAREWEIKDSKVLKDKHIQAWDVIFKIIKDEKEFEIEQYNILRENNLYTIEIASFNRTEIMNDYVNLITSFNVHKPNYKVSNDSYEKL